MHKCEKPQLDAYRHAVVDERAGRPLVKAIDQVERAGPCAIGGATRKTVPRGFNPAHPRANLLLHDGLWAEYDGDVDRSVGSSAFAYVCLGHFKAVWPIARWLMDNAPDPA